MIPADAELTARHEEIPAWDEMPEELKPVLRRQMEIYAGFLEFADHHVGRLLDAVEDLGVLDNTLVYYIIGDNGASAEGTLNGTYNEMINFNGAAALETPEFMIERLDDFGGPDSYNHYAVGWAHAMCTPYQWTKQVASHWGGTRNGTIVHWPAGIKAQGEVRNQFAHVIDVAPTVLEAAGLPEPTFVDGVQQKPDAGREHGVLVRRRRGRRAPHDAVLRDVLQPRHLPQGLDRRDEARRRRGCWSARRSRRSTTTSGSSTTRTATGRRRTTSSAEQPDKLAELQRLFLIEATKYNVLPLDDRVAERLHPRASPDGRRSSRATASCCSAAWAACPRTRSSASRTSRTPSRPRSRCRTAARRA